MINRTLFLIIILALTTICYSGQIQPVTQFSVILGNPHVLTTSSDSLTLEFMIDTDLDMGQYIAVEFPNSQATVDLGGTIFKFDNDLASSCTFYKDANTKIDGVWKKSASGQKNIMYCQTTGVLNNNQSYRMVIGLNAPSSQKSTDITWSNINLYAISGPNGNGVVIHRSAGFGNVIIFKSKSISDNEIFAIAEPPTSSVTPLSLYTSFDLTVKFKIKAITYVRNAKLAIIFPSSSIIPTMPSSVEFIDIDAKVSNKVKLAGSPKIVIDGNTIYLSGWTDEWLYTDREFGLIFKSAKTGESTSESNIIVQYYYANSNVVRSYSVKAFPAISSLTVKSFTVTHPELWDIYMTGGWPLKFEYEFDKVIDAPNGAYVVFQHSNYARGYNVFNFVASTCDFSQSSDFKSNFGQRNNCFSLQPSDLQFQPTVLVAAEKIGKVSTGSDGSGIFFKQDKLEAKKYTIIVWGIADQCGLIDPLNVSSSVADPLTDNSSGMFVDIKFKIRVYNTLDQTKRSGKWFSNSLELVTAKESTSSPKCYSVYKGTQLTSVDEAVVSTSGFGYELYGPIGDGYGKNIAIQLSATAADTSITTSNKYDLLMYKEFLDPVIMDAPDTEPASCPVSTTLFYCNQDINSVNTALYNLNTGYGSVNANTNNKGFQPLFLYSDNTANLALGKAVFLRGDFTIGQYNANNLAGAVGSSPTDVKHGLPVGVLNGTNSSKTDTKFSKLWVQSPGKLQMLFSVNRFEAHKSTSECGISWNTGVAKEIAVGVEADSVIVAQYIWIAAPSTSTRPQYTGLFYNVFPNKPFEGVDKTYNSYSDFALLSFKDSNSLATDKLNLRRDLLFNNFLSMAGTSTNMDTPTIAATMINLISKLSVGNQSVGGDQFTQATTSLGYRPWVGTSTIDNANPKPGRTCGADITTKNVCSMFFHLYTNCLKWRSIISDKSLFNYFDVIYRFMPAIGTTGKIVPNRVIRLVKLFPEAQGYHDVTKRNYVSTTKQVTFYYVSISPESQNDTLSLPNQGSTCLVQINYSSLTQIIDSNTNTIGIFLFNLPLLDTDATDPKATYPIGSLDGAVAYGLQSAPSISNTSYLGGPQHVVSDDKFIKAQSVNWGLNGLYALSVTPAQTKLSFFSEFSNLYMGVEGPLHHSQAKSVYPFLMGSVVLITGVKPSTNPIKNPTIANGQQDLFIPTRCPPYSNKYIQNADKSLYTNTLQKPSAYVASFKATDFKTFDDLRKILCFGNTSTPSTSAGSLVLPAINYLNPNNIEGIKNSKATVYFNNYADTSTNSENGFSLRINTPNNNASCKSFSVFASNLFKIDSKGVAIDSTAVAAEATVMSNYSSTNPFYVFGRPFYYSFNKDLSKTMNDAGQTINFSGLVRPATLGDFSINNSISLNNLVFINCNTSNGIVVNVVTNATSDADSFTMAGSIFKREVTSTLDVGTLKLENGDSKFFKGDKNAILKFTFSYGAKYNKIPNSSSNKLTTGNSLLGGSPVCSILNNSGSPSDCTVAGDVITCPSVVERTGDIVVCCYSVTINTTGTLVSATLTVNGVTTDDSGNIFISKPSSITTPYLEASAVDVITKVATLRTPIYSPLQESGLGRVTLTAQLPRAPVRDGKIVFEGTFTNFITSNVKNNVNVDVYLGDKNDNKNGNIFIESIDISNIETTTNSIVIITKKLLYECGSNISDVINFVFYPVELGKIDITKNFKIKSMGPGGSSASTELFASTDINYSSFDSYFKSLVAKPAVAFIKDKLCSLTYDGVYPRVPGGYTDFSFVFDLSSDTVKDALKDKVLNRFTIWFPKKYFGDWANSGSSYQYCSVSGKLVQCNFDNPTQLVVRTTGTVGTNLEIKVHFIKVGLIDTNISFPCSVDNESNSQTGTFTNILTGSGLMATSEGGVTGIQQVATAANTYNLRVIDYNNDKALSVLFPGGITTLTIRTAIDFYGPKVDLKIKDNPTFHVFLSPSFSQNLFQWTDPQTKPVIKVNNITTKLVDGKYVNTSTPIEISSTTYSGNRISGVSKAAEVAFTTDHIYLEIIIEGLRNPPSGNIGGFDVVITTTKYDYFLRTYSNADARANVDFSYSYPILPKPTTGLTESPIFTFQRGFSIISSNKWETLVNGNNMCSANAGKYTKQIVSAVGSGISQAVTDLTLVDLSGVFSFPPNAKYSLRTADGKVEVKIGTKCNSVIGTYLIEIRPTSDSFYRGPICLTNLTSKKSIITFAFQGNQSTTISGGILPAIYTLPESNVDEFKISSWKGDDANDKTASIAETLVPVNSSTVKTQFAITNDAVKTVQKFTLSFTNDCWLIDPTTTEVTPSIAQPVLTNIDIKSWIKCTDPATDTTLKDKLNSVRCSVSATLFPLNMFSAIVCKTAAEPTTAEITSLKLLNTNTNLNQAMSYYFAKAETYDLIYTGLVRGRSYKVIFVFETTQAETSKRTNSKVVIDQTVDPKDDKKSIDISTPDIDGTCCLSFNFSTDVSSTIKKSILEGLQSLYAPNSAGCLYVSYDDVVDGKTTTQYVTGYAPVANNLTTCPTAARRLRELSSKRLLSTSTSTPMTTTTPAPAPAPAPASFIFTLCASQSLLCATNISTSSRLRDLATNPTTSAVNPSPAPSRIQSKLSNFISNQAKDAITLSTFTKNNDISKLSFTTSTFCDTSPVFTATYSGNYDSVNKRVSVEIKYTDTVPLKCFYNIALSNPTPTVNNIRNCNSVDICGTFILKQPSVSLNVNISNLSPGKKYSVWYTCFNNVPNPSQGTTPKSGLDFTIDCPAGQAIASSGNCEAVPVAPQPSTNSYYLLLRYSLILLIVFMI